MSQSERRALPSGVVQLRIHKKDGCSASVPVHNWFFENPVFILADALLAQVMDRLLRELTVYQCLLLNDLQQNGLLQQQQL